MATSAQVRPTQKLGNAALNFEQTARYWSNRAPEYRRDPHVYAIYVDVFNLAARKLRVVQASAGMAADRFSLGELSGCVQILGAVPDVRREQCQSHVFRDGWANHYLLDGGVCFRTVTFSR